MSAEFFGSTFDGGHRLPLQQRLMIIRGRTVVTIHGAPIENGAVAVSGNRIVNVGRFDDIKTRYAGNTVDLGKQVLLPGLINAHCHLDYTCLRGKISRQKSFTDWIRAINAEKSDLSPENFLASINDGFNDAKRFGTTAIANLTGFPDLISQVQPPIRTCWFVELIDIRSPIDLECADMSAPLKRRHVAALQNPGLAPHALFTASKDLFRRCEEIGQEEHILLTTHLAESREEMEMFCDASGPLYEFIKGIGRPMAKVWKQLAGDSVTPSPARNLCATNAKGRLSTKQELDWYSGKRPNARTHLINRNECVAGDLARQQGARRENILHGRTRFSCNGRCNNWHTQWRARNAR